MLHSQYIRLENNLFTKALYSVWKCIYEKDNKTEVRENNNI